MAKWTFYVLVFAYMCYRAVYGARVGDTSIAVEPIEYDEDGFLEAGTRKTVNCRAPLKNQMLDWIDPFGAVIKRNPSLGVYAQEHFVSSPKGNRSPGLVLTFPELMVSHTGEYQCKSGEQIKTVRVCVIKPSEFVDSDDTPTEVTIEAGRSITLACQANGDPEPRLVWFRKEHELSENVEHPKYKVNRRYKILGYESLLTITSVEPEDAGLYQCIAVQESAMLEDCTAASDRNITLQVNYEPVFRRGKQMEYVYGKNNEVVELECHARGWPLPTYRWFKDLGGGALYEFNKSKIAYSEDFNTATLSVTASPTTYGNVYMCTATNEFGSADQSFKLLRREKPWKADNVKTAVISSNRIIFNMSWDDPVYFPVDSVSIQYIPLSETKTSTPDKYTWMKAETLVKKFDEENDDDEDEEEEEDDDDIEEGILVELDNLEPETTYFARLRAENEAGESNWSEYVQFTTSDQAQAETKEVEEDEEHSEETKDESEEDDDSSDGGMFYGIFFTGGILIVAAVCMFVMRMV